MNINMIKFPLKYSKYNFLFDNNYSESCFIFNSLHSEVIFIDNQQVNFYKKFQNKKIQFDDFNNNSFFQMLYKLNLLVSFNFDEFELLKIKINEIRFSNNELINAIVILGCNLNCSYCFEKWYGKDELNKKIIISDNFISIYIKYLLEMFNTKKYNSFRLAWFGGEPLLAWDEIKTLSERIKKITLERNIKLTNYLVTNGTLLNLLKNEDYNNFDFIQVTLDGPKVIHDKLRKYKSGLGTYDVISKNIKHMPKDFPLVLRINITENNENLYYELIDTFKYTSQNTTIDLSPIFHDPKNKNFEQESNDNSFSYLSYENYINIENKLIDYAIDGGYKLSGRLFPTKIHSTCWRIIPNSFHITTELKLYSCVTDLGNEIEYYGYIDSDGQIMITNYQKFIENKYADISIPAECKQCQYSPLCALSCKNKNHCSIYKQNLEKRLIQYFKLKRIDQLSMLNV